MTEAQEKFVNALLGEAEGDIKEAARLAGVHPQYGYQLVRVCKDDIIRRAEEVLALHAPKAALNLVNMLNGGSTTPGSKIRIEAAKQILDRAGVVKKDEVKVNIESDHALIIFPAKEKE